jgi:hypothetical protein
MVQRLNIDVVVAKHEAAGAATSLGGTTVRHETVRVAKESWVPDRDFEVRAEAKEGQLALRNDNLVLLRVAPELSAEPDPVHGLMVLVDTSASRALGFAAQGRLLSDLVRGLSRGAGEDTPLLVAGFDQEVAVLFEGAAGGFGAKAQEALNQRRALGASDLEGALAWAAENGNKRYDRLVLITDGVATIGDTEGAGVLAAARSLSDAGVKRMDALALGGLKDADRLHQLVTAGLPRDGVVLDGALPLPELGRRLSRSTTSGLKVAVEGASWVWPQTLDGVQPGDHVLIYADLPAGRPVRATVGGQTVSLSEDRVLSAPRPLLERAWVRARILRLLAQRQDLAGDPDLGEALKHQVIELSTKYRVLSPFTALLVLETEWDYQRYGIARSGLADILTVGAQGVEVLNRTQVAEKPRPTPPTPKPTRPQLRRDAAKGRAAPTAGSGSAEQSPSLAGPADEGGAPAPTEDLGATRGEADAFRAGDGAEEEAKQAESADDMAPAAAAPAAPPAPPRAGARGGPGSGASAPGRGERGADAGRAAAGVAAAAHQQQRAAARPGGPRDGQEAAQPRPGGRAGRGHGPAGQGQGGGGAPPGPGLARGEARRRPGPGGPGRGPGEAR